MRIMGYDLLKAIQENPNKFNDRKYKLVGGSMIDSNGQPYKECIVKEGGLYLANEPTNFAYQRLFIVANTELEEEAKEVDIVTALKAYAKGKCVYCDLDGTIYEYDGCSSMETEVVYIREIINGKWFIVD